MRINGRYDHLFSRTALVLCLLIHVALFALLRDALRGPPLPPPGIPMAVDLFDSAVSEPLPLPLPIPFRQRSLAPSQKTPPATHERVAATLITKPAITPTPQAPVLPGAQQILDSLPRAAAEIVQGDAPADRGFLTHRKVRLPSSDQALVAGLQLRKQTSLKTLVQGATKALHGAFACHGANHDTHPLDSEKLIGSPVLAWMDSQYDIGPDNEECMPEH